MKPSKSFGRKQLNQPCDVTCTLFKGIRPAVVSAEAVSWSVFVEERLPALLATEKRDKRKLPGFVLAPVDGRRDDEHTGGHTALAIDVDALPDNDLEAFCERCSRWRCAVYETPSSTDEEPRVRVIAALAEDLAPELVPSARHALAEELGLEPEACGTARADAISQVMFIGRLKGTRERGLWAFDGEIWTPPADLAARPQRERQAVGELEPHVVEDGWGSEVPNLAAIAKCVPPAGLDGDRHLLVRGLGGWLAELGYGDDQIADAIRLQIPSSDPDERARQALEAARRKRSGLEAPGWKHLSLWADQYGDGTSALEALETACRHADMPQGWSAYGTGEVWSEWWARYLPRFVRRFSTATARAASALARSGRSAAALAERREQREALRAELAPGLDLSTDDSGAPYGTADNLIKCVRHFLGQALAFDTTAGAVVLLEDVKFNRGPGETLEAGPWQDHYTVRLQAACNRLEMRHAYGHDVRAAVQSVARERPLDVLGDWLRGLSEAWDGTPRVDGALARYWRAEPGALASAVSRVMLLSIAARGLLPGCQQDCVPVLIGQQGCGKSQSLGALVWGAARSTPSTIGYGADRRFCRSKLAVGSKDAVASIRGYLVWELAELASVSRAHVDEVKAWLTQQSDTFRAPYAHEDVRYLRSVTFVGSVNPEKTGHVIVNRDTTGGRRWLPVYVAPAYVTDDPSTHHLGVDVHALERDHEQLLGEAARRVLDGEKWHPTDTEVAVIAPAVEAVSDDPVRDDPWFGPIRTWVKDWTKRARRHDSKGRVRGFTIGEIFAGALDIHDAGKHGRAEGRRVGEVLRTLGYASSKSNGVQRWNLV